MKYEEYEEYEEIVPSLVDTFGNLELHPLIFKKNKKRRKIRKQREVLDPKNIFEAEIIEQRKKTLRALDR